MEIISRSLPGVRGVRFELELEQDGLTEMPRNQEKASEAVLSPNERSRRALSVGSFPGFGGGCAEKNIELGISLYEV